MHVVWQIFFDERFQVGNRRSRFPGSGDHIGDQLPVPRLVFPAEGKALAQACMPRQDRVDLFALGVTAFEMFTGELPWEEEASLQTLLSHMNSPGRDPLELRPDLGEETAAFLVKAIERDPKARFQTPAEFREALKELPPK